MIINEDDINYILITCYNPKLERALKRHTFETVIYHPSFGWSLYVIHKGLLKSRCLESEIFLSASGCYYSTVQFDSLSMWPEMEEVIRRHSDYKFWYELDTGMRI